MTRMSRRERLFAWLAMGCAGGAALVSVSGSPVLGGLLAATTALIVGVDFLARRQSPLPPVRSVIEKVVSHVDQTRKLAIYERDTGLFAHWYVELRGNEECDRAGRYGRALTMAVIEPVRELGHRDAQQRLREWLRTELRHTDIAGYVGNGRYVVIMPEADADDAWFAVDRLKAEGNVTDIGLSSYPDDGENFEQLYKSAAGQLPPALRHVA